MKNDCSEKKTVEILKTQGPQTLADIASQLGISTEGARFQLHKLEAEGQVSASTEVKGRGRPRQIWSLTPAGHALFPDAHSELAVRLIASMREALSEDGVQAVLDAQEKATIQRYLHEMGDSDTLEDKLKKLVEIREREGYMADYQTDSEGYLFIENHCPICAAAQVCQGLCRSELNVFQTVLGRQAKITRVDHIIAGARRCAYRISVV